MMHITILTLFPKVFHEFLGDSIPAIAQERSKLKVDVVDIRDYSGNKHKQVDDYQYGGGAGMVMKPEPIASAIEAVAPDANTPIVYFTPQGRKLTQKMVREFLPCSRVILLCGHYKEIDQRVRDKYVTHEISVGDYVLSGGELPAMIFTDAIARLLEGVLNDMDSALTDSHENGLLGYPCYTRPYEFQGMTVPEVLCSGHHKNIEKWRAEQALQKTKEVRPDLLYQRPNIYLGLVHYPVYNKTGDTITASITNLDIHDISRSSLTYGVKNYFLIQPNERQKEIFQKLINFWNTEDAAVFNADRAEALSVIRFSKDIQDTVNTIKNQERGDPIIITTTAKRRDMQQSFAETKEILCRAKRPVLILFGTGNGLHNDIHLSADIVLEPIQAASAYNHLSVRSAVAIVLDRLLSEV